MQYEHSSDKDVETIEISQQARPLLLAAAGLPVLTLVAILLLLVSRSVPYGLMALLLISAVFLAQLASSAIDSVWPTKVVLDPDSMTVKRLLGATVYPWHEIAVVKVTNSPGHFSDDPRCEPEGRFAVGIFQKAHNTGAGTDREPDVVLCTGTRDDVNQLVKVAELIDRYARKRLTRNNEKSTRVAQVPRAPEFRRRPAGGQPAPQGSQFVGRPRPAFGRRDR
jgi:hypothetical protein